MAKKQKEKSADKEDAGFELNETKKVDTMPAKNFFTDGRFVKILGLLSLLSAVFMGIAFTSYLFSWQHDQDKVFSFSWRLLFVEDGVKYANKLGRLGAILAHFFFYNGIGLCSYFFVAITFTLGINLISRKKSFPVASILAFCIVTTLWLSATLSFIFSDKVFPYGGAMGDTVYTYLNGFAGFAGTAAILVIAFLTAVVSLYNLDFSIRRPQWLRSETTADVPTSVNIDNALTHEAKDILESYKVEDKVDNEGFTTVMPLSQTKAEPLPELELKVDDSIPVTDASTALDMSLPEKATPTRKKKPEEEKLEMVIEAPKAAEPLLTENKIPDMEFYDPTLDLSNYKFPSLDLLEQYGSETISINKEELEQNKNQIVNTLRNYGIEIDKIKATVGPTVTLYEIIPAAGVRISKIKNLEDDIALSLSALGIRIIAPIPGKGTIGIEVPNMKKQMVSMRSLLASEAFQNSNMDLPIALGKNISNENIVLDLAKMPHLLVAGSTGQGKSVGLNAILVSLLYKKHPSQLKFVMVDPKKVELTLYKHIEKHFLAKLPNEEDPIITDTKKVVNTLNSLCIEMDRRYDLLKEAQCRNLKEYNDKFRNRRLNPNKGHEFLPYIVLVIDEFADLIMTAGKEVEMPIARLAQLARAIGIHLIIATQRPSVNIITGTIKANFPARIGFRVSSKIDSRTILDAGGADQLIGKGDMLVSNGGDLIRVQCAFVDTPEIEKIVQHITEQQGYPSAHQLPEYIDPNDAERGDIELGGERDEFFKEAARIVVQHQQGSTSLIQRRLKLGYNRAGRIMDQLETAGVVGPNNGSKAREVKYKTEADLEQFLHTNV